MSLPIFLTQDFKDFIAPNQNRKDFLCNYLTKHNINFSIIPLEGKNHIYINFSHNCYDKNYRIKTLLVHYDRFGSSPGANDNSAAVFQVLNWICNNSVEVHNMRIFFTDGEELGFSTTTSNPQEGILQGSFFIAQIFKRLGIVNDDIIVLDCCGRGETLVVSTAGKDTLPNSNIQFNKKFNSVYEYVIELAKQTSAQNWITAPVPYGDNAGFISQGIPAVAVTVLPKQEATEYLRNLQKNKNLSKKIMNHTEVNLPTTWKLLHTPQDAIYTLTESAFSLMSKFLNNIAKSKRMI